MKKIKFTPKQAKEFAEAADENAKDTLKKNAKKLFSDGIMS